jgi:hypothetical protein
MALRIGFDLDGTLADMEGELIRQAEILFGQPMARPVDSRPPSGEINPAFAGGAPGGAPAEPAADNNEPPLLKLKLTKRQQGKLWGHVESIENFWQTLRECEPGIVERLGRLAGERRWEIIFLTKRPEGAGATAQLQSQLWLEARGFHLPSVYVVQGSRGRIAAALGLDVVVDDRPENCLDVAVESKARAILIWREGAGPLPAAAQRLGIGVVKTVAECLDILTQLDSREQPGMLSRVKRLLGLKEPAGA